MGLLVDALLNLARIGRHAVRRENIRLNTVIEEIIFLLKPETEGRKIEWKIVKLPIFQCDPVLVKQVVQNLVTNALKFTRPRTQTVIEIGHENRNGQTAIFVRDNGVGFSMKYADKLFGVFQRLHSVQEFEGTGVGLAIVQRIVTKHGGRAWAEGKPNKGATFSFDLPKTTSAS